MSTLQLSKSNEILFSVHLSLLAPCNQSRHLKFQWDQCSCLFFQFPVIAVWNSHSLINRNWESLHLEWQMLVSYANIIHEDQVCTGHCPILADRLHRFTTESGPLIQKAAYGNEHSSAQFEVHIHSKYSLTKWLIIYSAELHWELVTVSKTSKCKKKKMWKGFSFKDACYRRATCMGVTE